MISFIQSHLRAFGIKSKLTLLTIFLTSSNCIYAQEEVVVQPSFLDNYFNEIVLGLVILVLLLIFWAVSVALRFVVQLALNDLPEEKRKKYESFSLFGGSLNLEQLMQKLTDAVPVVEENDIMLDHEYDGIKELDNHLPPWWKYMFYLTIIWGVGYFSYHYVFNVGKDQYEKYEMSMIKAEEQKKAYLATLANNVDESNVVQVTNPTNLAAGKKIYLANCVACHGDFGEGKIGPNLTDDYWLHGNSVVDIFKIVKYGVPNKMVAWQEQLLPGQLSDVTSYVMSLKGSNPPNAKEPQGELVVSEANSEETVNEN